MSKLKIFNDPLYGLINFPFELIYEIIDHPYFQRLRRIGQVGLSNLVYPGAVHTRFHHALGVAHLCSELIKNLRFKGVDISDSEYEATCVAALIHDIGHGPFSHALEFQILPIHHEKITLLIAELINTDMKGRLDLAIQIFTNQYHKGFLHQLLSGQVDVDRMDYLNRDSYYTGVAEGIIGYDRIIRMMNVYNDQLVVEKKGLYSLEKFFIARYLMYRQVYMHKTAIGAEQMLKLFFEEYKQNILSGSDTHPSKIKGIILSTRDGQVSTHTITQFASLDDADIIMLMKSHQKSDNYILRLLSNSILNRVLFKVKVSKAPFTSDQINSLRHKVAKGYNVSEDIAKKLVITCQDNTHIYDYANEMYVLDDNQCIPFSHLSELESSIHEQIINYVATPIIS